MSTNLTELSREQVQQFNEQGYIILGGVFSDSEIEAMAREADRLLELAINSSLATGERNPRLDAVQQEPGPTLCPR